LVVVAGLVWLSDHKLLFQRRGPRAKHGAGALELPGGKVERGEAPTAALKRELVEEWGHAAQACEVGAVVDVLHHIYPAPGPEVLLLVYQVDAPALVETWDRVLPPIAGAQLCAFSPSTVPVQEFLAADRPFLQQIVDGQVRRSNTTQG